MSFQHTNMNEYKCQVNLPKDFLRVMNKLNKEDGHHIKHIGVYSHHPIDTLNIYNAHINYGLDLYMEDIVDDPHIKLNYYSYTEHYYHLFIKTCKVFKMEGYEIVNKVNFINI